MRSIIDMLETILACPSVDQETKTRAGFLLWSLKIKAEHATV
jgi:hypothetical protein